jgi:hypothetical protein
MLAIRESKHQHRLKRQGAIWKFEAFSASAWDKSGKVRLINFFNR